MKEGCQLFPLEANITLTRRSVGETQVAFVAEE